MIDETAGFIGQQIGLPHGVWRMLTSAENLNSGFYCPSNQLTLSQFAQQFKSPLQISGNIAISPNHLVLGDNVWRHEQSLVLYRAQGPDSEHGYYLGWFILPDTVDPTQIAQVKSLSEHFTIIQDSYYVDVYSSNNPDSLLTWLSTFVFRPFDIVHGGKSFKRFLQSPTCDICWGVHRSCPLSDISNASMHMTPLSRKHPLSEAPSYPSKQPRPTFTFNQQNSVLLREELVQRVVERVLRDRFILVSYDLKTIIISDEEQIEAPPCSGKTTLMKHIRDYIRMKYPDDILHFTERWPGMKSSLGIEPQQVSYSPTTHNDDSSANQLDKSTARNDLIELLQNSLHHTMWILIDEAQLTYGDEHFWSALYNVTTYTPEMSPEMAVKVIAAGSYGSHTGSSAHSPPSDIRQCHRMSLFQEKDPCFLAFTEDDAITYMRHVIQSPSQLDPYISTIIHWASPWRVSRGDDQDWVPGLHPGVVAGLTMLLYEKVCCLSLSAVVVSL